MQTTRPCIVSCCVVAAIGFVTGALIGHFATSTRNDSTKTPKEQKGRDGIDPSVKADILNEINAESIKENLRFLTRSAHLAGTPADLEIAQYVRELWKLYGLDVEIVPYEVLLSYPRDDHINTVSLVESNGTTTYTTSAGDVAIRLVADQADGVQPFNGFSGSGNATGNATSHLYFLASICVSVCLSGELVYANYGQESDFAKLKSQGINCTGRIVIARYGKIFRGNKALSAQKAGAIGLILYSDPADYNPLANNTSVFPNSWWMPGSGVQRGGLAINKGDQYTPGYPSTWYAYRLRDVELNERLHRSQFISQLQRCSAFAQINGWTGSTPFISRRLASYIQIRSTAHQYQDKTLTEIKAAQVLLSLLIVKMDIQNYRTNRTVYNVIGKINGAVEKDRYVLIGNHLDAWIQGAVDPSSGTATLLEIARVFGRQLEKGWVPRRTLVFCSWAAEEYGMVGSTEWVEEHLRILDKRAVAYLNVDIAVQGNTSFSGKAVPLLRSLMLEATKQVTDPRNPRQTVYDAWVGNIPDEFTVSAYLRFCSPFCLVLFFRVTIPGSGSDFHGFILLAGVPVADSRYTWDHRRWRLPSYPLYHTAYDLFDQMLLIDPYFRSHQAVARVNAYMLLKLLDARILPLDVQQYALAVTKNVDKLQDRISSQLQQGNINIDSVMSAAMNFSRATTKFQKRLAKLDLSNDLQARIINDQLMGVERVFIEPHGLPGRPEIRHVVFAPSLTNNYAGVSFSGITDLLHKISSTDVKRWEEVKKQISVITYAIQSAANLLAPVL
ncbi:LOW QUALITY PROTEIN: putative N-acetylated-alpha-linked acidic dipeptidase [Liolophura sinensis]|uniref:LOW QUALITY PROTEIN: putative N-acetylated-alpha-linked acidic dipeptidase n=1 Tax=Liolophura sinensis TaxID=3198878 RepID=UPI0031593BE0